MRAAFSSTPPARAASRRGQADLDRHAGNRLVLHGVLRRPDSAAARARRDYRRGRRSDRGNRQFVRRACRRATRSDAWRCLDIEAPATSRPTIQIAPRCALLPPVACSMSCSPARPICASSARNSADGSARRRAVRASAAKVGSSACAERSMVARSRSRCAPLPRRSTSAGFGVSCASSISAVTAKRASCASDCRQLRHRSAAASAGLLTVPCDVLSVSTAARDASSAFASGMASASHSSKAAGAIVTSS